MVFAIKFAFPNWQSVHWILLLDFNLQKQVLVYTALTLEYNSFFHSTIPFSSKYEIIINSERTIADERKQFIVPLISVHTPHYTVSRPIQASMGINAKLFCAFFKIVVFSYVFHHPSWHMRPFVVAITSFTKNFPAGFHPLVYFLLNLVWSADL